MRTLVQVEVVARKTVRIWVEHEPDEDPADLTQREREQAFDKFEVGQAPEMDFERVEVVP